MNSGVTRSLLVKVSSIVVHDYYYHVSASQSSQFLALQNLRQNTTTELQGIRQHQ